MSTKVDIVVSMELSAETWTPKELAKEVEENRDVIITLACEFLRGKNHTGRPIIKSIEELQAEKDILQGDPSRHPFIYLIVKEQVKTLLNVDDWNLSFAKYRAGNSEAEDMWNLHKAMKSTKKGESQEQGITMAVIEELEKDFAA